MVSIGSHMHSNGVEHWNHVPSFRHHAHCRKKERGGEREGAREEKGRGRGRGEGEGRNQKV